MSGAEEVILFSSIAEYEARLNYVKALRLTHEELDRIVGKYELPVDRSAWACCGLNNCNTEHRYGYVIRAKDGRETNIGNACGEREFGVQFKEVEARYKKAEDAKARRQAIEALMAEVPQLVARAEQIIPIARLRATQLAAFRSTFQGLAGYWTQLLKCAKQGGAIRAAAVTDGWSQKQGGKADIVTVGRFAGAKVLLDDTSNLVGLVERDVLPWLRALDIAALLTLDDVGLASTLKDAARMRRLLEGTEAFSAESAALLTAENVAGTEAICSHLMRSSDAGSARAVIEEWVKVTLEKGIPLKPVHARQRP